MTEKLFYNDGYIKEFEAVVTDVTHENGRMAAAFDQTAFYPEGGGQGADRGIIRLCDGRIFHVTDVQEGSGCIWHYLSETGETAETLNPGARIFCSIDWERRFDHMQQHSGEHIVSGMICRTFHCNNAGFHMGEDTVTVDFDTRISFEDALRIEARANQYIWEDHPVEELWPSRDELEKIEYRSKKEIEGDVRLISFPGADICACCGTHVSKSAQVGLVKFISAQNFHEGTRLELLCGKRAAEYLSKVFVQARSSAVMLSTNENNLAVHVDKLKQDNIKLRSDLASVTDRLFEIQADQYAGKGNVLIISDELTGVQARDLADRISDRCGATAAVFAKNEDRYQYAVINKSGLEDGFIKNMNAALNGKGGGRDGFAQGSVNASAPVIREYFKW